MAKRRKASALTQNGLPWARAIGLLALVAIGLRVVVVQAYRTPSESMEDTVLAGDYIAAGKLAYGPLVPFTSLRLPGLGSPKAGDPVIFRFPHDVDREILKRCVAGPGQTVEIRNKILYVDGERTVDPRHSKYIDPRILPKESPDGVRDNYGPVTIPPGHYFLVGDNRDNSDDSRFWGFVPESHMVARADFIYFSWRPDPAAPLYTGITSISGVVGYNLLHFFDRVRWDRIGMAID